MRISCSINTCQSIDHHLSTARPYKILRLNSLKGEEMISVLGKVILATVFVLGDDGDDDMGPN